MSPAVNTPGTLVIQLASVQTLPRSVRRTPNSASMPSRSGRGSPWPTARVGVQRELTPAIGLNSVRPFASGRPAPHGGGAPGRLRRRESLSRHREHALAPSSCAGDTLNLGPFRPRVVRRPLVGGRGMARCGGFPPRMTVVAIAPVSPPPMMTTCLPSAEMKCSGDSIAFTLAVLQGQEFHRVVDTAKLRPGTLRSGRGSAAREHDRIEFLAGKPSAGNPTWTPARNRILGLEQRQPPVEEPLPS